MKAITLASVEEAFKDWRAQRCSRKESIPEALWVMALGLYPDYSRSKICKRLQLSGGQFKRRIEGGKDALPGSGFVYASKDVSKVVCQQNSEVKFILQGKERALTFYVDSQALPYVLPHIGALL